MEGKLAITRHFFKIMMPGFPEKLNLPPAFCKMIKEMKSEQAVLKSRKGTWKINVCRNRDAVIFFKDGWPQFVHHHSLSIGDFLVFEHKGALHFNVFVFDMTACEKEFLVESKRQHEEAIHEAVNPSYHPKMTRSKFSVLSRNLRLIRYIVAGELEQESVPSHHGPNSYFVLTKQRPSDYPNRICEEI